MQRLRRLLARRGVREADGAFVVEGATVLGAVLDVGAEVEAVYLAPDAGEREQSAAARAAAGGARVFRLAPGVVERVADTVTPQPLLAVVRQPEVVRGPLEEGRSPFGQVTLAVVLVGVQDPGNAGTVLRSAAAAGCDLVATTRGTVDLFNPKTVRASAGAVMAVPLVVDVDPDELLGALGSAGIRRLAAAAAGGQRHDRVDWRPPTAIILGNERRGLPGDIAGHIDGQVTVAMSGSVESLNVSMAATVLCFEAARQRSNLSAVEGRIEGNGRR